MTIFLLLMAVAAGWCLQLFMTYRQSRAFTDFTRALRALGTVSVGKGGRRYRGGVAFIGIAVDGRGVVAAATTLRGFTTFARPRPLPVLKGLRVAVLAGEREVAGLRANEREAARQAATLFRAQAAAAASRQPDAAGSRQPTTASPVGAPGPSSAPTALGPA